MNLREFLRFHLLKALLVFIVIQMIIFAVIQNYNHRPVAQRDVASVIGGRSVKITPVANDADKDENDELSLLKVSMPMHGKAEQKGKIVIYTPTAGFTGVDSFAYSVTDGRKNSEESYIIIEVNKNLAPAANRDAVEVYCGGSAVIDVLANDRDAEGDSMQIKAFTNPIHGQLYAFENKLIYKANNASLPDSFKYVSSDGRHNSDSVTVIVQVKSKNDPQYPWLSSDIGDVAKPGSFKVKNNSYVVEASGSDIWNSFDGFRYAYQFVNGDCEMLTKVESLEGTNEWAKAGIMVRETLTGGSKMALLCMTNKNGVAINYRINNNEAAESGNAGSGLKAPYWVKLVRKANVFNYYISENGSNWKEMGKTDLPMNANVYIGFAVTSHNNNEICKVVFGNSKLNAKQAKFGSKN